ncbi:GNAT family N-acetyltransferase [Paenochrobactrum pullorum]|uniref:GNAT family N-acetyltransferase n=1 Tax=Paenochrobactrum pullorum TaxID=1324351 RepID=UPI0035BBE23F
MWVRTAAEADLKAVHELLLTTWSASFDDVLGKEIVKTITNEWHSLSALKANLKRPYSEFLVADDGNGRIIGMAYAHQETRETASLNQLYVLPEEQIKGVGTTLLDEIETAFPGVTAMKLEVLEVNVRARRFYEQKGYIQIGRNAEWGSLNFKEPVLILQKSLNAWVM